MNYIILKNVVFDDFKLCEKVFPKTLVLRVIIKSIYRKTNLRLVLYTL